MHQLLHVSIVQKHCFFPRHVAFCSALFHRQPPFCGRMWPKVNWNRWWSSYLHPTNFVLIKKKWVLPLGTSVLQFF